MQSTTALLRCIAELHRSRQIYIPTDVTHKAIETFSKIKHVGVLLSKYSYVARRCRYAPLAACVVWIRGMCISRRLDDSRVRCELHWLCTTCFRSCV